MVMLLCLFLVSGLATASVVSQHLGKPMSDTDADNGNAPSMFAQSQTGGQYADADGNSEDSTYPVQSKHQNMAERKNVETPYLSLSQSAGLMGDAALADSDVESMLASDIGNELHSPRANEQTIDEVPESDMFGDWDQNVNKLVGSDDATGQTMKQQQDHSSQKLAGEGQEPNGVKGTLLPSSSESLYAASASEGGSLRRSRRAAISIQRYLWPSGIVPYEIKSIFSSRYCGTNLPQTLLSSNMRMVIEYTRPAGQSGTGFVANYQDECGYTLNGEKGSFFPPDYASDRLPNDKCIWKIKFPVGFYAYIRIHNLQINQTQDCLYNYLEIFDGPSESSPSLYKLCSHDIPERLFSTGNEMIFRFVLNGSIGRQGFLIAYTKEADCGKYLKADQGTFTSPKYPNWCPPNQKCDWKIEVPVGFAVILSLRGDLHPGKKGWCPDEYIEIYDGPSRSSPLLRKLCGSDIPTIIGSTNNTMTVRFVSGWYPKKRTLKGEFRKAACGGKFNADEDHIAVPRYPSNHLPNNECTWTIEVPVGFHIALTREIFAMTENPQCLHDYLEVFDGPSESSPSLYKLCGHNFPPTIWSTNNTMTVRFVVNSSIEGQVFEANYRKQAACGGYLREDQGNFTSPGYPITYPPSVRCVWNIEVSAESYVVLTFENIEVSINTSITLIL
nr:unnamed protein product [Spirometra erinaceieuropaei]